MIFRSAQENFNPQIHNEELSLTVNMNKDMSVHNKVIDRFNRYTKLSSFLFQTGRVDGGAKKGLMKRPSGSKEIHDNAYRVQFKSLNIKPAYSLGVATVGEWFGGDDMSNVTGVNYSNGKTAQTVGTDTLISIAVKHDPDNNIFGDKFNPQDSVVLNGGLGSLIYIQRARRASTHDHYILDGKIIGKPEDWDEAGLTEDEVLMEGGNYVGEGSTKGYQRFHSNYWKIFYSFQSRYSLSFTGNSLRQSKVIWTGTSAANANSKQGYWQFEEEWYADEMFSIFLELACRFSASSMDASGHKWFENFGRNLLTGTNLNPEAGITPPRTPDGWVRQFKDTIDLSYDVNDGFSVYLLESVGNVLAANSPAGSTGNTFIVLGDDVAHDNWDKAMKRALGWDISNGGSLGSAHQTRIVRNIETGSDVKLGFGVKCYEYKGNEYIFMKDELLSHPGLNNRNGGLVGTGNMYILNVTPFDGVSNFELFTGGKGRFFKKKFVDGMHSLDPKRDAGNQAASGFDGAFMHYLSELMPINYVEDTCCVIRGTGKYAGGALAGNAGLSNFPTLR